MESTITITVTGATGKLSKSITDSIQQQKSYKYTYLKQLISRLRIIGEDLDSQGLPIEEKAILFINALIIERNIAAMAAEQYAAMNQSNLFDAFMEIVDEIEELLK